MGGSESRVDEWGCVGEVDLTSGMHGRTAVAAGSTDKQRARCNAPASQLPGRPRGWGLRRKHGQLCEGNLEGRVSHAKHVPELCDRSSQGPMRDGNLVQLAQCHC